MDAVRRLPPAVWVLLAVAVGFFIWLGLSLGTNDPCDLRGEGDVTTECREEASNATNTRG